MIAPASNAAAPADAPAISVQGVSYRYANALAPALDGITLHIPAGEIFGLLGPNGAGKSTLLGLLSGSRELQTGAITIVGEPLPKRARQIKRCSALVPQEYAFYESLSGWRNLEYFGRVFGLARALREQRIARAVTVCRLEDFLQRPAGEYSGGLKRRLNLAIGLLNEPRILYLDEPTVGIDAESRRYIVDAVHALKAAGTTIIYTSHYMEEVEQLCDSVAVIAQGRVVLQERMEALLRREGSQSLEIALSEPNAQVAELLATLGAQQLGLETWSLSVVSERLAELLAQIATRGGRIERVQYGVSRLEKIYLELLLGMSADAEDAR